MVEGEFGSIAGPVLNLPQCPQDVDDRDRAGVKAPPKKLALEQKSPGKANLTVSVNKAGGAQPACCSIGCRLHLCDAELSDHVIVWPTNPKMFSIWSFLRNVHSPWSRVQQGHNVT